jgi:hypothetical protein
MLIAGHTPRKCRQYQPSAGDARSARLRKQLRLISAQGRAGHHSGSPSAWRFRVSKHGIAVHMMRTSRKRPGYWPFR